MSELKSELAIKNLRIINNYDDALSLVRNRYYEKARTQMIGSDEQEKSINLLLALDFMIQSNQQVLNYLNHFKTHQRALSTKALQRILENLETDNNEDIHATILRFKENIFITGTEVSKELKNDYNFRGNIYGSLATGLLILSGALGPILAANTIQLAMIAAGLSIVPTSIFVAIAVVLLMVICKYQTNLYAQPGSFFYESSKDNHQYGGRMEECLEVLAPLEDPKDFQLFEKSYGRDFTVHEELKNNRTISKKITSLFPSERQQPISTLRDKFAQELANDVEREYRLVVV